MILKNCRGVKLIESTVEDSNTVNMLDSNKGVYVELAIPNLRSLFWILTWENRLR